jgi:DNA polymerase III subunit delta'
LRRAGLARRRLSRLDGTGGRAVEAADELLAMIADAMAPLAEAHAAELAELEERVKARGERGSGRAEVVARHKREERRYRVDEIRAGLTELSRRYRDELATAARPTAPLAALEAISGLADELVRNPNERLQLVALIRAPRTARRPLRDGWIDARSAALPSTDPPG